MYTMDKLETGYEHINKIFTQSPTTEYAQDNQEKECKRDIEIYSSTETNAHHYPQSKRNLLTSFGNPLNQFFLTNREESLQGLDAVLPTPSSSFTVVGSLIQRDEHSTQAQNNSL